MPSSERAAKSQATDSARRTNSSSSNTQRSQSRGLDFDRQNQCVKPDHEPTPDTFNSQDEPSIQEKYSTQGLGAPYHVSFGFFQQIFRDNIDISSD
jgi:hypothetical protein